MYVHRLDLGLYSHPKEFCFFFFWEGGGGMGVGVGVGMESEPMLIPREKSPLPENSPQRKIEPTTLHYAGQQAQHNTNELFRPLHQRLKYWYSHGCLARYLLLQRLVGPLSAYCLLLQRLVGPLSAYCLLLQRLVGPLSAYCLLLQGLVGPLSTYCLLLQGLVGPLSAYCLLLQGLVGPLLPYRDWVR